MQFLTSKKIIFGRKSVEDLSKYTQGKTVIISGENTWKNLKNEFNIEAEIIIFKRKDPSGEPTEEDVEILAERIKNIKPQTIIAVGGGSIIDATKIARIIYEHDLKWDSLYSGNIPPMSSKLIAIETTSGTGSGVSAAAVVKDKEDFKAGVVSPYIIPDIAIYDPDLTETMPERVAVYTGMDALTHAIEAYTSNVENIISDTLALKAIEIIYKNIKNSVLGNKRARELVHYGNMLAGIGFTNSRLGLCHSVAHWLGGKYGISHGKLNAILLPYVIKINKSASDKFKDISNVLGVEDVVKSIIQLNKDLNIPFSIDIKEEDMEYLSRKISKDRLMQFNPRSMNEEEIFSLLKAVKEGNINEI